MVKTQKYVSNIKENSRLEKEIRQKECSRRGKIANFQTSFKFKLIRN